MTNKLSCRYSYKVSCITFRIFLKLNEGIEKCTIFMANKLIIHRALLIEQIILQIFIQDCIIFRFFLKLNGRIKKYLS